MNAKNFFSDEDKQRILDAIRTAEADTSGEIRVHVSEHCPDGALNAAAHWFAKLKMHRTALRNGVLFYLSVKDRQFAILGDAGINSRVPTDFWENVKDVMSAKFRDGLFADGLEEGIHLAGSILKEYFPHHADDENELPDDLSFG
ncbi:MAG: TPM domain-containing protein [Tannerella sp.]|jgi:uncharacterized membrane protein|nr:TPM domain-containing protein [Tannerella sp.]